MSKRHGWIGIGMVLTMLLGSVQAAPVKSALPSARETVEVTADGSGASPAAALSRALANAVQQVTGVATSQLGHVETSLNTLAVVKPNGDIAVANWAAESTGSTLTFSQGSVKSYRVLSEQPVGKGWRVRVRAAVLKAGGADAARDAMPRLAVVVTQSKATDVAFSHLGDRQTVLKRFRARLQQSLLQSGAVRVLERDNFAAQADELTIADANPTAENLAKLGQRFSADYVVVIDAQRLRLVDRGREIYGAHLAKLEAELQADIRIIDVATGELIKTNEVQKYWSQAEVQAWADQSGVNPREYPDRFEESLLKSMTLPVQQAVLALVAPSAAGSIRVQIPVVSQPIDTAPARETPGSSDKPFSW